MRTVLLDNYDSFTYNLYQYIGEIDEPPVVFRNDAVTIGTLRALEPDRIVISPGPGRADDATYFGVCAEAIRDLGPRVPVLGVCLGHQGIVHAFGGEIVAAPQVMHGKTSLVRHDGHALFDGVPRAFEAMRYHSLAGEPATIPSCLQVLARSDDGVVMAVRHRRHPIYGVQFHPESVGTPDGKRILANFMAIAE